MSFLRGLVNIIDVIDKATNEEFQITRENRPFKILVEGRVHDFAELWVYDVTATDVITGTSEKVKHFDKKEDGVNEAVNAVIRILKDKGLMGNVPAGNQGPTTATGQTPLHALAAYRQLGRKEHINQALMKMLTKQGFVSEPSQTPTPPEPTSPPPAPTSPPPAYHHVVQSASSSRLSSSQNYSNPPASSQKVPLSHHDSRSAISGVFQYGIEPDVDGLYTSTLIPPAEPDPALLDPRCTYITWQSSRKGFVYILNNNYFPYLPPESQLRRGSEVDVQNVIHVFSQLGYEPLVFPNLKRMEILATLEETVGRINDEGDRHSSLCLFFMSHGNEEGVCGTDARLHDRKIVTRKEIKDKLSGRRCKALLGKPKLIFIQACRGNAFTRNADEFDSASGHNEGAAFEMDYIPEAQPLQDNEQPFEVDFVPQVDKPPSLAIDLDSVESHDDADDFDVDGGGELPNNSDIFVANATSNGYYSIRMQRDGSWFVQAISEVFLEYAHVDDLNELMRKVTCLVTERFRSQYSDRVTNRQFEVRQTPAYESQGMRRRFYFLPKYPSTDGEA